VLPEFFQLLFINVLLLFALLFSTIDNTSQNASLVYTAKWITPRLQVEPIARVMVLGFICSALLYFNNTLDSGFAFGLIWDDLSRFMNIFLCLSCAFAVSLSTDSLKRFSRYEFLLILWLSAVGMHCLIKSYSFLAVYLSIELQSLSFYMLSAMRSRTEASAEAGLKYFILSAFSSSMLLLGMALIYGATGVQGFGDLAMVLNHFLAIDAAYDHAYAAVYVGLGSICISLYFKLAAAPLHAWIADVYEGCHTSITAWFAITAKIAVITVLIRLNTPESLIYLLMMASSASLVVGSLSAMRQVKLKRFIAFSAVSNAGWFLLGLCAGSWQYTVLHLMIYTILSINLFSIFILPLLRTHPSLAYRTRIQNIQGHSGEVDHGADSSTIKYISDLNQIYKVNPCLAFAITMSMFSLAGIPPLAGFYSKYLIINGVTQSEQYLLLAVSLAAAVISAFYYIRVVKTIYFSTPSHRTHNLSASWFTVHETPVNAYISALTTGLTLVFFLKPDYFCVWLALI
jgi:proton-translocating NADH-quinone oxidoreductase chain N